MKKIYVACLAMAHMIIASGQGTNIPEGNLAYKILERLEIATGLTPGFHSEVKPFLRKDAVAYALRIMENDSIMSAKTRADLQYLFNDNNEWLAAGEDPTTISGSSMKGDLALQSMENRFYRKNEKPVFGIFYRTPANFWEINKKDFHFRVNPMIHFAAAKADNDDELIFLNRRGIEIRGGVDDRIFFYTNVLETQARFPDYVNQRIARDRAVPGAGLYKSYKSSIFDITNGYDFLTAQAYIGFNVTRHVGVQFGHGRNFIGNGYRSVLLSDFSNNYFFLKLNWRVWKFHFQNIFGELIADRISGERVNPKKYFAAHYLSFNPTERLSIGLFETTVFNRSNQFELQYLNPVILYRTVEHTIGSPDNVLLGLNAKWNFLRRFQLYGQFIFDEFKFNELFIERRGWWANKFAWQAGAKYVNAFGIDHLDFQLEWNGARPYTYTHFDSSSTYTNHRQPLAHPLGANFKEWIVTGSYRPLKNLFVDIRYIAALTGEDEKNTNWGSNVLLPYGSREMDYGNEIGQGSTINIGILGVDLSYMIYHNIFLDLTYFQRIKDYEDTGETLTTRYIGGGIRMNVGRVRHDF